jgi:lysozyme
MDKSVVTTILSFSAAGLVFLASQESYSPMPYKDTRGVITNGFGNASIEPSKKVTVVKALADLKQNASDAGSAVTRCITVPLTQNQYDAFVSFTYNVGTNAFCKSTMVKKANANDLVGACNEFRRWEFVAGKDCRIKSSNCSGIAARREAERALCLKE